MKKLRLITAAFIGLVVILFLVIFFTPDPNRPIYQSFKSQPAIGPYTTLQYEFGSPTPFEGGLVWIKTWLWTNRTVSGHVYLYDIDRRLILGELLRSGPGFFNHDQSKVLCITHVSATRTFRKKFENFIEKFTSKKIRAPQNDTKTYWVLDLKNNSCTWMGEISQLEGSPSDFEPSPDFRHGFMQPSRSSGTAEIIVCDLQHSTLASHTLPGLLPMGWWDSQHLLMLGTQRNFVLYDIETRQTKNFLMRAEISKFLSDSGTAPANTRVGAFFRWNGRENQFFLFDETKRWGQKESFLIKVERPEPTLKLLDPKFKFEWSDDFHSSLKFYAYSGRNSGQSSDAVYLRDLTTGTNLTLAPTTFAREFSTPKFYKDTVIYVRSNMLWQTDFTGTNTTRLFPPSR